jgi:hypothetical protein
MNHVRLLFGFLMGMAMPVFVVAQAMPSVDECLMLKELEARLACYDKIHNYQPREAPKVEERPRISWKVRDSGTVSPIGDADLGAKPGLFQIGRNDREDFTTAKIALIGVVRAFNQPDGFFDGWQPFVGASWDRDTSAETPKDLRQALVGISGQVWTWALPTLRMGYKRETKARTQGAFTNLHADIIYLPLVNASEGSGLNSWALVPYIGIYSEASHVSPETSKDGIYTGPYVGSKLEIKLGAIAERLSLTAQSQHYRDASVPTDVDEKTLRFRSAGLKYDLVDPDTKSLVPSLSLSWQRGSEPVTGEGPSRKMILGFGIKYN